MVRAGGHKIIPRDGSVPIKTAGSFRSPCKENSKKKKFPVVKAVLQCNHFHPLPSPYDVIKSDIMEM